MTLILSNDDIEKLLTVRAIGAVTITVAEACQLSADGFRNSTL